MLKKILKKPLVSLTSRNLHFHNRNSLLIRKAKSTTSFNKSFSTAIKIPSSKTILPFN